MLHWSKSGNSTNPRWPPDAILHYKKAFIENDRESSVLDSRHLQATFLKNQLSRIFFHFKAIFDLMLLGYLIWGNVCEASRNTPCQKIVFPETAPLHPVPVPMPCARADLPVPRGHGFLYIETNIRSILSPGFRYFYGSADSEAHWRECPSPWIHNECSGGQWHTI